MIAAGRGADVEGLGLDEAGVELDERGLVKVDGALRTSARRACTRSATSCRGPRSRTRPPTRASSRSRTSPGWPTHPISYVDIPRATFCTPNVGSFGLTEEQAREQGYDVVVGKVPYGAVGGGTVYGDRTGLVKVVGESTLRRAARRAHRRLARHRADPGARQRARARGRLPGARAHHPRTPDAVGGGHGSRPRRRRLADPRLGRSPREVSAPAAAFYFDLASPLAYLAAERILQELPGPARVAPVLARELPGARSPTRRSAAARSRTSSARRSRAAPRSWACSRCAGRTRSRSTARSRCAWPPTPSRSAASCRSRRRPSARRSRAGARSSDPDIGADRRGGLRDAPRGGAARRPSCARSREQLRGAPRQRGAGGRARRPRDRASAARVRGRARARARPPRRCAAEARAR